VNLFWKKKCRRNFDKIRKFIDFWIFWSFWNVVYYPKFFDRIHHHPIVFCVLHHPDTNTHTQQQFWNWKHFFLNFIPHFWTQLYRELFICETVITQLLSWRKTKFAPFYDSVKKHFFGPWANRRKNSVSPGKHFSIFVNAQMQSENIWNRFSLILSAMQQNKKQEIVCVSVYVSSPPPYLMMMMMMQK
jgi:hypothetical protein